MSSFPTSKVAIHRKTSWQQETRSQPALSWWEHWVMCPARAQSCRQISETKLAPFPWCSFEEGASSSLPTLGRKRLGNGSLHSNPCTYISAKRDYCNCPLLSTKSHTLGSWGRSQCHGLCPQKPLWTASMLSSASPPTKAVYVKTPSSAKSAAITGSQAEHETGIQDLGAGAKLSYCPKQTLSLLYACVTLQSWVVSTLFWHKPLNLWLKTTTQE